MVPTHCPFDHVTARWNGLDPEARGRHARRLIGRAVPDRLHDHEDFSAVIAAAADGDLVAFAWLAEELRPALLAEGRVLLRIDRVEWAGVALEWLHRELRALAGVDPRWQRRRLHHRMMMRMRRAAINACREHGRQVPLHPDRDVEEQRSPLDDVDLTLALERVLAEVDPAAAEGLVTLAAGGRLADVAASHDLAVGTLRKRMSRARPYLREELADWRHR